MRKTELRVQSEAAQAAVTVCELVDRLPRRWEFMANQLRRSAASVTLNIAEASGRLGGDRSYHHRVAYGSALETKAGIELLGRSKALPREPALHAWMQVDTVCAMLWPLAQR